MTSSINSSMSFTLIDTASKLEACVAQLASTSPETLFIDTEFFKRNTYYPILGLVQVAFNHNDDDSNDIKLYLLDAVQLDLTAFWQQAVKANLWVMHACSEDVDIIHLQLKKTLATQQSADNIAGTAIISTMAMPPIFDTQIGLSFLDFGLQISYQDALAKCLSIDIEKEQSLSDWLARPLTKAQLHYAANDVLHLPALFSYIASKLKHKNLYEFALEDSQSLKSSALHSLSDEDLYQNWADFRLSRKQLAQLRALCAWREQQARSQDIPRTFVLKKPALRGLLDAQPRTLQDLNKLKDIHPKIVRKHGQTILQLLQNVSEPHNYPHKTPRPFREPKQLGLNKSLKKITAQKAAELGMPSDVMMRKRWLSALYEWVAFEHKPELKVLAQPLPSYLTGWRMQTITQALLDELSKYQEALYEQIVPHEQKPDA